MRAATGHEAAVQSLLAPTANPEAPNEVNVSQPSDVLTARAAAAGAFDSLFLGLGVVALITNAAIDRLVKTGALNFSTPAFPFLGIASSLLPTQTPDPEIWT